MGADIVSRHMSGFKAWLIQRVSAVYLALFTVYAVFTLILAPPAGFVEWKSWITATPVMVSILILIFFVLIHAWIGIRDVLIDYIPHTGIRLFLLSIFGTVIIGCGLWAIIILAAARMGT